MGPDFSHIDSAERAEQYVAAGFLERLLLFPAQFGGAAVPQNVVYVPIGVGQVKDAFETNVVRPLIEQGHSVHYRAVPAYQGRSFVPSSIMLTATNPGHVETEIVIWGDALARSQDPDRER